MILIHRNFTSFYLNPHQLISKALYKALNFIVFITYLFYYTGNCFYSICIYYSLIVFTFVQKSYSISHIFLLTYIKNAKCVQMENILVGEC